MKTFLVFLAGLVCYASANPCTSILHGRCYNLFSGLGGACTPGHVYTLNYCGALEMCCYYHSHSAVTSAPHYTYPPVTAAPVGTSHGTCGTSLVGSTNKIVGGYVAQHGEFPWQVSLRIYNQHVCGGTLISDQWVLTAAHCFEELGSNPSQWTVGVGIQSQQQLYQSNIVHVSAIYPHRQYNDANKRNDIALMKLSKRVDITGRYVRAACLPRAGDTFDSDVCTVSGWGATYYDASGHAPITQQLEYVNLQTITNQLCQYYLGLSVYSTQICAGATSSGGKDACQGDSGGPFVCKRHGVWELAGVVSWGDGCGKPNRPGVYTRVSSYLSWIQGIMH